MDVFKRIHTRSVEIKMTTNSYVNHLLIYFYENHSAAELKVPLASWITEGDLDMAFIYNIF